jgi:hypothetical protein
VEKMSPWSKLNKDGKLLLFCCVVNLFISVILAVDGSLFCFFPFTVSMFCGLFTLNSKYQK